MTRRKVILPYWTPSKEEVLNKEALENKFGDLSQGEVIINYTENGSYLTVLDSAGTLTNFDSSKIIDKKISESIFVTSAYTDSQIADVQGQIDDLDTKVNALGSASAALQTSLTELSSATSAFSGTVVSEIARLDGRIDSAFTSAITYTENNLKDYATQSFVTDKIVSALTNGTIDLTGYAKTEDVKATVSSAKTEAIADANAYTDTEIGKLSDVYAEKTDLEGLATETWVSAEIAKAQLEGEDVDLSGYATKDDIKDFATEQFVTDRISEIQIPSVEGLATEEFVTDEIAKIEIPTLDGYATEAWVGEQGFLTEHQDISGLATKEEVSEAVLSAQTYADSLVENLKPYDGGTAVDVVDYTVNVNVAEDGFLKVNEENELTVTGVTLDAAVTSKDITIEGGQWATAVKTVFTGGTVPAGTTWQSFLESMLCVEKFDTSYSMSKTFTVSCGTLGEGITGTTNNSSVEVGTKVSLKSFKANPTTASQSYTVSTFDYGYKLGEDGTYNKNTSFTEKLTPSLKASNDALTATFTTFVDESGNTIAKISGNTSMGEVKMRVMDGTNKVVIAQTGDTYTASSAVTAGTIYVATNLKNYYKSDKKTPNTYTPSYASEDKTATASTTYTVTGYRNTFYGTTSKTDAADATFIRTLTKSNKAIAAGNTISFDTNSSDGHLRMVIASPRTIKSVKNSTGTQDLTALLVGTKKTDMVGGVDNFAPISYNIYDYTWKSAFGNETWIITFA